MNILLLPPAQAELDEAFAWYESQAPGLGQQFLSEALHAFHLARRFPHAWHPLSANTRRCRLKRFPYGVVYAIEGENALILASAHLHRKPGYWRARLRGQPGQ